MYVTAIYFVFGLNNMTYKQCMSDFMNVCKKGG
jgi:hypothetical protein